MALEAAVMPLEGAPRVGVVPSATSRAEAVYATSQRIGINLFPWQRYALWVEMQTGADGRLQFQEACDVVARQNGKTEKLIPRIVTEVLEGRRVVHTAQNRIIPRGVFLKVARIMRPDGYKIREANGQEQIIGLNGGSYTVIAPKRGVRGLSGDTLILDEVREYEDFEFIGAAEPILTASDDPQTLYCSNAGEENSVVLNDLRIRGTSEDPRGLVYLEWSAPMELAVDDREGWRMANPSPLVTLDRLERLYEKYRQANELAIWETEHLCRWVLSMFPRLVQDADWQRARRATEPMQRPSMGINVDPSGTRVSVAFAWPQSDGSLGLMARDFTGSPVNLNTLAVDLLELTKQNPPNLVGFDPWTDQHLARHFPNAKQVNGSEFANACERFVRSVETGALRWEHAEAVSGDLPYTARKPTTGTAFIAERAKEERSISAVLAAIRAVWIASEPKQAPVIY